MKLNLATYISFVMAIFGCAGFWLAGKGRREGWMLNLAAQPVWFLFGIVTRGYGICLTSLLYGYVFAKNLARKPLPKS
jgi:hypothetical protein